MVSGFFFNACWSSLLLPSSSNWSLSWHKNTSSFQYSNLPKKATSSSCPQESLDVDMRDKRMNAEIQKGRNSSFVPAGSADFSNCPYRLAEREWDHWWTVGQALDGIFVQRAICRKTSVYWPPPPPSEGTRGADTSCPSTPTWLSARRTPSLPALCADTRAGISDGKRCRGEDNGVLLKAILTRAHSSQVLKDRRHQGDANQINATWPGARGSRRTVFMCGSPRLFMC